MANKLNDKELNKVTGGEAQDNLKKNKSVMRLSCEKIEKGVGEDTISVEITIYYTDNADFIRERDRLYKEKEEELKAKGYKIVSYYLL